MYFTPTQVISSLKRLESRNREGKTNLEKTSSLMYFLSFDATCRRKGIKELDLDPNTRSGKDLRIDLETEFSKLLLLNRGPSKFVQVVELGKVTTSKTDPVKRISSNFLTVPLKKASEQGEAYFYPRRPPFPLLNLGLSSTGIKWGISRHSECLQNLPKFLSEVKEPTPYTDLAIFISRDTEFSDKHDNYLEALQESLEKRFTTALANFWIDRIIKEKMLVKHIANPFSDQHNPIEIDELLGANTEYKLRSKAELIAHIEKLEYLLKYHKISF